MAEWKQLDQAIYTTPQRALWSVWNWLVGTVGWRRIAEIGTWTPPGDALAYNTSGAVLENPAGAPFRQSLALNLGNSPVSIGAMLFPWLGVAGGYNPIGPSFDAPYCNGAHYLPASSPFKMTAIASDAVIMLLSWWTPVTVSMSLEFKAGARNVTRLSGSWLDDGYTPGAAFTVSGSASNNYSHLVTGVTAQVLTLHSGADTVADETVSCTVTPKETARFSYFGRIVPYESATADVRPAVLNCTHWGMGGVDPQTTFGSPLVGWQRIHADVGAGYLNLASGYVEMPRTINGLYPLALNPTFSGVRHSRSCELLFRETVSAIARVEQPGRLDGVYLCDTGLTKQRIEQSITLPNGTTRTIYLMAREGFAVIWPSGAEII